jgi:GTPase SAR1 family protein
MDTVGFLTSVASSMTAAVLFSMSQRLKGRLKALHLPPPVRVDETRNSILLVGIGGVGKTSLIKALTHDLAAEPDTIGPFKFYKHVEELGNEPSGIKRTNLYFADYPWQNLTDLIGRFLLEQKQPYCPLRYGFLNSLIMVVDVTESPKYPGEIFPKAQNFSQKRVEDNLKEWNSQSIQAILGLFTRPQLKYICLFINKVDLLVGYDEAMENEIKEAHLPLMRELKEASDGVRFECLLGSAARDLKIGELKNALRCVRGTETA